MLTNVTAVFTETDIWIGATAGVRRVCTGVYDDAGKILVGDDAAARQRADPEHYEARPWTFLPDKFLVLRQSAHPMPDVCAAILRHAGLATARGGRLTVVHPTCWGGTQLNLLQSTLRPWWDEVLFLPLALAVAESAGRHDSVVVVEVYRTTYCAALVNSLGGATGATGATGRIAEIDIGAEVSELAGVDEIDAVRCKLHPEAACLTVDFTQSFDAGAAIAGAQHLVSPPIAVAAPADPANTLVAPYTPMPQPRRNRRRVGAVLGAVGLAAGGVAFTLNGAADTQADHPAALSPEAALVQREVRAEASEASERELEVQIGDVMVSVPDSWYVHWNAATDDVPGDFRAELLPRGGDGAAILLARTQLGESASAGDVVAELRRALDAEPDLAEEQPPAFLPRPVAIYYEEKVPGAEPLRWFVMVVDSLQLTVGCEGGAAVELPCLRVLDSLRLT